jgi:hypothetical protein
MEKINALIEKLQELKNSNAGLQTISYYVQLLQAEVLHARNTQLHQKSPQSHIAVIMPSHTMANEIPHFEDIPAPVTQATTYAPPVTENVPVAAAQPVPVAAEAPVPKTAEAPAPPPVENHPHRETVILQLPKLVAAYTPPVVKHPPAQTAPAQTTPTPAAATPAPAPVVPAPAPPPPVERTAPAATYTPTPAAAMPPATNTVPPVPPMHKPAPTTLFDTPAQPAPMPTNHGHRHEHHADTHNIRKELNELVGQTQSNTSLNERLRNSNVEIAEKLRDLGVKDLRDAIGINDKFQFIQELFRGDRNMYDRSIKTINECTSMQEAEYWIERELKISHGWQDDDGLVKHFYSLVKKRFS